MKSVNALAANRLLWTFFVLTLLISLMFPLVADLWRLSLLDTISDPAKVREAIAMMSEDQRLAHSWITATLDVVYPIVYGIFFIGCAYAFYGRFGQFLAIPLVVLVAADLAEGLVQVFALNDWLDWVDAKAYLTPLKFALFLFGISMAVVGFLARIRLSRINQRKA